MENKIIGGGTLKGKEVIIFKNMNTNEIKVCNKEEYNNDDLY